MTYQLAASAAALRAMPPAIHRRCSRLWGRLSALLDNAVRLARRRKSDGKVGMRPLAPRVPYATQRLPAPPDDCQPISAYLLSGTRFIDHELACLLIRTYRIRYVTPAGFVLDLGERSIRLLEQRGGWRTSPLPPEIAHDHILDCRRSADGLNTIRCIVCGQDW